MENEWTAEIDRLKKENEELREVLRILLDAYNRHAAEFIDAFNKALKVLEVK